MRCPHPRASWFDRTRSFRVPMQSEAAFALCCHACGADVPFGPSNDDPFEVMEEMRLAARLATASARGSVR